MSANGTKTDMLLALTNVCFEGKNGYDADLSVCPLMTQSGHSKRRLNRYDERGFLRVGTNFAHLAARRFFFCASSGGSSNPSRLL